MRIALGVSLLILPVLCAAATPEPPEIGYPLVEMKRGELRSQFNDPRSNHPHRAIDLMRPRGTAVMAVTDGVIRKLFRSAAGGISIYLFDGSEEYCFFYGHLDHYARNLHEGQKVRQGEVIGYVGYTGNAKRSAPHLHFAVSLTGTERRWSGGVAIDPYPMLVVANAPSTDAVESETAVDAAGGK